MSSPLSYALRVAKTPGFATAWGNGENRRGDQDVDTTAAMTGAIAGASVGSTRLPQELVRSLSDQGEWEYEALVELARQLHALHLELRKDAS